MKIALACCPSWSADFPPYNISLLKAILKENGHEVKNFDFNIDAFHFLGNYYWEGQNYFYWEGSKFTKEMLPKLEERMDKWVDSLLDYDPDFIGFSVYHTSICCTIQMCQKIRERDESKKIMMGGPQCFAAGEDPRYTDVADYIITGEGENAILEALKYPEKAGIPSPKLVNMNELPVPDYEDYDLMKYRRQNGVSLEASRGCIAKCAFCIETHYWAYRSKKAVNIVNEVKECIAKYGVRDFRFNDSLVNGNIKEFRKLVDILSEEQLGISWDGYARINGKMDADFMKKIKESGNILLSYGVESGSQKILDDMRKGITVAEIEQNLKDANEAGLFNHINWMVGFPTEEPIDFLYSLIFLHNNKAGLHNTCPGMTCGIGDKAELQKYGEKFKILPQHQLGGFVTEGLKNTKVHRFIRLKLFHIWMELLKLENGQYHKNLKKHYQLTLLGGEQLESRIKYEDCIDFSYLSIDFESSFYAEYMLFFWAMYKVFGSFEMMLTLNKDLDLEEFGSHISTDYNGLVKFHINENGKWKFNLLHSLIDKTMPFSELKELEGKWNQITNS